MSKAIKIAVSGASGKMGIEIINLINKTKNLILNTALDQKDSPHIGKKIKNTDNKSIEINCDFNDQSKDDVFIDFTRPEAILKYISCCVNIMFQWLLAQQDLMIFILNKSNLPQMKFQF